MSTMGTMAPAVPGWADNAPASLTWKPLEYLTLYRLILATALLALFLGLAPGAALGQRHPLLFGWTNGTYLLLALVFGFAARRKTPTFSVQVLGQVLADILAILLLIHASGGLDSGLTLFLVVAVAAGALLLPGRIPFFFAAVATLGILLEYGLEGLRHGGDPSVFLDRAGLLGVALFTTAGLAFLLARRIRATEALAEQRGIDLANLERLNDFVLQRFDTGVLVVDEVGRIRLANRPARQALGGGDCTGARLDRVSPALGQRLAAWQRDPGRPPEPLAGTGDGRELLPRFKPLGSHAGDVTLIFLEYGDSLTRQTRQLRLAALGKLTASIAHEIRNPLAAISYAGQLLEESRNLDAADRHLAGIIHQNVRRMNDIVETVLQLSRDRSAHPEVIEAGPWLETFAREFGTSEGVAADRVRVRETLPGLMLRFDPGHLQQILWNLCRNALQHGAGPDGTPPRITLRARAEPEGGIRIEVEDDGPAIDPATAAQMFEPFYTTRSSGNGLGLFIAHELCQANAARLGYRHEDGHNRFFVCCRAATLDSGRDVA